MINASKQTKIWAVAGGGFTLLAFLALGTIIVCRKNKKSKIEDDKRSIQSGMKRFIKNILFHTRK